MNEVRQVLRIKWQKLFWELRNQCSDTMMASLHLAIFQEMASEWQSPLEQQHCCLIMFCPCFSTLIPQSSYKGTKSNLCRILHREKSFSRTIRCFLYISSCWSPVSMDRLSSNTYKAPQPLTLVKGLYVPFNHQKGEEKFALLSQLYDGFWKFYSMSTAPNPIKSPGTFKIKASEILFPTNSPDLEEKGLFLRNAAPVSLELHRTEECFSDPLWKR